MPLSKARPNINFNLSNLETEHLINIGKNEIYLPLENSFLLTKVSSNTSGNLRIYKSVTKRDADRNRSENSDPTGNHGLVLELGFTNLVLNVDLCPIVIVSSDITPIPALFTASESKYLLLNFAFLPLK
ncbi:hypothetical protein [uncultured Nostoc sp.]|uniref:hypothetical protein n=1 Tax=uncultured Nostoc sp. TaxID=340711 RepID=UPI0035CBFD34